MNAIALVTIFSVLFEAVSRRSNVAICFYGLTRSLNYTLPHIVNKIISPLEQFANVRIFVHTYNLTHITNARSRESNVTLHPEEIYLLNPHRYEITDQAAFLAGLPPNHCRKHGDAFYNGFTSMRNVLCQLESLRRVTEMMMRDDTKFDAVVYSRPDVLYFNTIEVEQVLSAVPNSVYVPMFHRFFGSNDRFAFGRLAPMIEYGLRGRFVEAYCQNKRLHSEMFLTHVLRNRNITMRSTSILFSRVRANGLIYEHPSWSIIKLQRGVTIGELLKDY